MKPSDRLSLYSHGFKIRDETRIYIPHAIFATFCGGAVEKRSGVANAEWFVA
jgi:hypothetical protein